MAFNLKQVLKALLFSSSQPLSIKEIQETFARFHEQGGLLAGLQPAAATTVNAENAPEPPPPAAAAADGAPGEAVEAPVESTEDAELYQDVPSLVTTAQIREAMDAIATELRAANDVLLLTETAQGFRVVTQPRFARWIRILRHEPPPVKLTQSAMETLAVIAYRQPVTRAEIEHIRGVSAEASLNRLLERELIYIVGRADLPGRPIQYGTTDAFLEFIGARSLDELPASDVLSRGQIDAWLQNAMGGSHPSDQDVGLSEEGEEQLSLDDAARAEAAQAAPAGDPAAGESSDALAAALSPKSDQAGPA